MDMHASWLRSQVAVLFVLAILSFGMATLVELGSHPRLFQSEHQRSNHKVIDNASSVVERGVVALRDREPDVMIRGMLDPDYDLSDFESAALAEAQYRNANAEFILGWLSEDGYLHGENWAELANQCFKKI